MYYKVKRLNLLLVFLGLLLTAEFICCQTCEGIEVNGVCYTIVLQNRTFDMAKTYCEQYNGQLASVTNAQIQSAITALLERDFSAYIIPSLWIGAKESVNQPADRIWHWASDGSRPAFQGCYIEDPNNRDIIGEGNSNAFISPLNCIQLCNNQGYQYAGVQNGGLCYCDNDIFGMYGSSGQCDTPCRIENALTNWCGGNDKNHIYDVRGNYAQWGHLQPNNFLSYQMCAVLDQGLTSYKFADETCNRAYHYICRILSTDRCSSGLYFSDINGTYYEGYLTRNCYYFSKDRSRLSWYMANERCLDKGGYLVKVEGNGNSLSLSDVHDELREILDNHSKWKSTVSQQTGAKLWIGLYRGGWSWVSRETFRFSNWYVGEPNLATQLCAMMTRIKGWRWSDEMCNSYSYFACMGGNIPKPATTTTTTTKAPTRMPINTVTPVLTTTIGTGGTPVAGASTGGSSLSNVEIVLIVVLLVMAAIAVLVVILLCIYCCKKKERKVSSKDYYTGIIHPSVKSDTGRTTSSSEYSYSNKFIDINDTTDFFSGSGYQQRY